MNNEPLVKSPNYSEHHVDFAVVGKGSNDTFCIQMISNKPFPVIKSINNDDPENTNIQIEMQTSLAHECSVFLSVDQLKLFKQAVDKALGIEE